MRPNGRFKYRYYLHTAKCAPHVVCPSAATRAGKRCPTTRRTTRRSSEGAAIRRQLRQSGAFLFPPSEKHSLRAGRHEQGLYPERPPIVKQPVSAVFPCLLGSRRGVLLLSRAVPLRCLHGRRSYSPKGVAEDFAGMSGQHGPPLTGPRTPTPRITRNPTAYPTSPSPNRASGEHSIPTETHRPTD